MISSTKNNFGSVPVFFFPFSGNFFSLFGVFLNWKFTKIIISKKLERKTQNSKLKFQKKIKTICMYYFFENTNWYMIFIYNFQKIIHVKICLITKNKNTEKKKRLTWLQLSKKKFWIFFLKISNVELFYSFFSLFSVFFQNEKKTLVRTTNSLNNAKLSLGGGPFPPSTKPIHISKDNHLIR